MGKHYNSTIGAVNELINFTEDTQGLTGSGRTNLALASIAGILSDIDVNLAAIADALEEKKDDKA